ncbi:UDP-N-acetylmuramoyl-tripeptide--D-alanyl-D-alanine ligase [Microlunatus soli]|uniref:UDP-N-acetylmuramoyl-tripeptide--D-alanyl-D-alanine ligase n=1 Tax=Microlunatus soli TaxID=630515 RepID=A0A1H1PFB7_9ACTN|nr:UDP-N-acetylmuramoyl-tripeptide--D-alanyl-D-alanine ligase [Microlunatus soli]SDS09998.1 UDP-N-acetylmuramoyl-tripeptide--D-alanyl-D-alanine ligase [Microlunatus soli]
MINNTVGELAELIGARVVGEGDLQAPVGDLVYDSRSVSPGSLFVAFLGERVDGHDYAVRAWQAGAVAAITQRPVAGGLCLVVDDPQTAMGLIGRHVVAAAKRGGLRVIGITGSAGKTTTKDLLAQILERAGSVVAPRESMNNEIGLPVTASWVTTDTQFLVSEMGAKGIGHIGYLCSITPPDIGLELNVGVAHLGKFGSQDAIAEAKGELVEALPADGRAVLNAGDPRVWAMAGRTTAPVLGYAVEGDRLPDGVVPEVYASALAADDLDRWAFELRIGDRTMPVRLRILGRHQVGNAVAAAAAGHAAGVDPQLIADTLSGVGLRSHWRMELHELSGGAVLINDAYNANPPSMQAALTTVASIGSRLQQAGRPARLTAVLGEMLELGEDSVELHRGVGRMVVQAGIDRLITIGAGAEPIADGALAAGMAADAIERATDKSAAASLLGNNGAGDVLLIKASRDVGLETLGEQLVGASATEA